MGMKSGDPYPTVFDQPKPAKPALEPTEVRLAEVEKKIQHIEKYLEDATSKPKAKGK